MNDGSWVASNIDLARNLAENALESYDWTGDLGIETESHTGAGDTLTRRATGDGSRRREPSPVALRLESVIISSGTLMKPEIQNRYRDMAHPSG